MNKEPKTNTAPDLSNTVLADAVFRPMLFSTLMVRALLNGSKTQTRRTLKDNVPLGNWDETLSKSPVKIGDIIWVRETFQYVDNKWFDFVNTVYKADEVAWDLYGCKWKPSLFMPKEACRLFLKVIDVRIERLQDISEDDAISEGILRNHGGFEMYSNFEKTQRNYCLSAVESYKSLWEKINGKYSWVQNPFVWVYRVERVECPRGFR